MCKLHNNHLYILCCFEQTVSFAYVINQSWHLILAI